MFSIILAVWFLLRWFTPPNDITTPGEYLAPLDHYEFYRFNASVLPVISNIYKNPMNLGAGPPVPHPEGGHPDSGYVSITADPWNEFGWRHGGTCFYMLTVDASGNASNQSNIVVVATAMPDTNFTDGRIWQDTGDTGGIWRSNWAPGDVMVESIGGVGPVVHQELVQIYNQPWLCRDYGYWCLKGARQTCP